MPDGRTVRLGSSMLSNGAITGAAIATSRAWRGSTDFSAISVRRTGFLPGGHIVTRGSQPTRGARPWRASHCVQPRLRPSNDLIVGSNHQIGQVRFYASQRQRIHASPPPDKNQHPWLVGQEAILVLYPAPIPLFLEKGTVLPKLRTSLKYICGESGPTLLQHEHRRIRPLQLKQVAQSALLDWLENEVRYQDPAVVLLQDHMCMGLLVLVIEDEGGILLKESLKIHLPRTWLVDQPFKFLDCRLQEESFW